MQRIEPTRQNRSGPRLGRIASAVASGGFGLCALAGLVVAAVLAGQTVIDLREANRLAARSYEDALATIGSARSASAALSRMRADHEQLRAATNEGERFRLVAEIAGSRRALAADLGTVAAHAQSVRASQAAVAAQEAVADWQDVSRNDGGGSREDRAGLDRLAAIAETQFRLLENVTAQDGLAARSSAETAVAGETRSILGLAGAGLVLVVLVAWNLVRRRGRVLAAAAAAIDRIAASGADHEPEDTAGRDLAPLRPALARLAERVREERRNAGRVASNHRLAEALAASHEGFVVIDAQGCVAFANPAAGSLLGLGAGSIRAGQPASRLLAALGAPDWSDLDDETRLADGRWLRVSRARAADGGLIVRLGDIGERKARELQSSATRTSFQTALDSMSQGLCLYDSEHRLVVVNRRYEEIYRLAPGSMRSGMTATDVLELSIGQGNHPGRTLADLTDEAWQAVSTFDQGGFVQEIEGGRIVHIVVRPTAESGFVATYEDVTERWHSETRIAYMARHDALTDLPNRVLLAERIEGAITQASRETGFAVHCLDLDNFKQINDTLGHAVGDELLRAVAHRLMACLRESDTVARLGGDEFAIVQTDVERPEDAAVLARHVIEVVSAPYELTDHSVGVGLSIGVSLAPAHGMAADRLLKNADVALYRAKGDGRGRFRFFETEMDARLQARRLLEIDLRAAMAAEAFALHFQPIYDLAQDRICGFEALLRWTHPIRGRVSPAEFVPLAEEIGLIVPLGAWVLRRACEEASGWPGELKIAVNVSPAQFQSADLIRTVRAALGETGLAPQRLELEITETVLLASGGATVAILHALRGLGVRISMDDFGTGYSSLSYLRSFPFHKMKIDQSFIRDLAQENGSGFIVKAVISLGSSLGMTMTAEGVETEDQLARLREEGCDEVQGYLFSPPVPAVEIPALLEKWNGLALAAA